MHPPTHPHTPTHTHTRARARAHRNCPFHIAVFQKGQYSYRDLPLRVCELGTVYRYERSGTMHGA